jgi:hypothetical protein
MTIGGRRRWWLVAASATAVALAVTAIEIGNHRSTAATTSVSTAPSGSFGDNVRVDLAMYARPGVSDQQIEDFIQGQLSQKDQSSPGVDNLAGVQFLGTDYGKRAIYITFSSNASSADRAAVANVARASRLIACVVRDQKPAEFTSCR